MFKKVRYENGLREFYFLGKKFFSYKKRLSNAQRLLYIEKHKYFEDLSIYDKCFYIKKVFENETGYIPNIENPRSFNEKIQWMKLYYHNPLMTKCADKYLVRDYVSQKAGEQYLIPLLGVWNTPDEIDFDCLPENFVLKVNWGSGQNIIVREKSKEDIENIKQILWEWIKPFSNHYFMCFEWVYKNIKPKIIAEKYVEQMDGKLLDYKFFCFNGKVFCIQIDFDRSGNHTRCFYDRNWKNLHFSSKFPLSNEFLEKPKNLCSMIDLAECLSQEFPHVRVDLYNIDNEIKFGEMTFSHGNGMEKFCPEEWDFVLGRAFSLPEKWL